MPMDDLLQAVPKLISRVDSLEMDLKQTKLTMGNAIVKLVKKVKKLEGFLKRRNLVLTDSEDEEPKAQGRKSQDDPQDSSIQGLVTPPTTKDRRYKRRKETKSKKVVSSLDFQDHDTAEKINTAGEVNAAGQYCCEIKDNRDGESSMLSERTPRSQRNKFCKKKIQGTWKITQLKKLNFEEVKKEFDKLVKQIESFAPISFEATKASLKRFGEELQTKTPKMAEEEKMMKQRMMNQQRNKVDEQEETNTGTETPINPVPVAMKTPSVATYKIIKQGEKREIVMNRYGVDGPEDKLEKGFWKCLRIMFEEPLSTDSIWSEIGQQKIISWRYYDTCRVHCLNLESMDVYMLSERKYPLSAEVAKGLTSPEQTATGKGISNPFMAVMSLPKNHIGIQTHHVSSTESEMVLSGTMDIHLFGGLLKNWTTPDLMANW
ncbi:hypothetical protein Tco_0584130 [Tanacetum coccineum]